MLRSQVDQLELAREDVRQGEAEGEAKVEASKPEKKAQRARTETVVDIDEKTCPCCQGALHKIGEDVSERLDVIGGEGRGEARLLLGPCAPADLRSCGQNDF